MKRLGIVRRHVAADQGLWFTTRESQDHRASINAQQLLALLAGQGHEVILVESVERLPEALVRDAFSDPLRLAVQDRSVIILTADADDADARELEVSCERAIRPALGTQAADLVVAFGLHAAHEAAGQDRGLRDADAEGLRHHAQRAP